MRTGTTGKELNMSRSIKRVTDQGKENKWSGDIYHGECEAQNG